MRDMVITSSLLIIAILFIRYIVKGKIHPLLQYSLWLLVVLKLLIPMPLWSSPVSVLNLLPQDVEQESVFDKVVNILHDITDSENSNGVRNTESYNTDAGTQSEVSDKAITGSTMGTALSDGMQSNAADNKSKFSTAAFLVLAWFVGMIITGGYMLFYQIKCQQFLHKHRKPLSAVDSRIADALGITLPIYTVEGMPSPCLIGRSIYLTDAMAEDKKQLEHILAHEYCHYRQMDFLWVVIRCVLTAVYWFNPLIWAAAYISKQDSELACDAAVIHMLGEDERISYGKTLINLNSGDYFRDNRIGAASMMGSGEKHIRERIFKIARRPKYIAAAAGVVVIVAAALIAVTFSGTSNETEQQAENVEQTETAIPEEIEKAGHAAEVEKEESEAKVQTQRQEELAVAKEEQEALKAVLQAEIEKKQEAVEAAQEETEAKAQAQQQAELEAAKEEQEALVAAMQAEIEKEQRAVEAAQKEVEAKAEAGLKDVQEGTKNELDITNYINPCPSYTRISNGFGTRVNPITSEEIVHTGIDLAADGGTDILAAADGTVYEAGYSSDDGNYVIIHHGAENYTHYDHCAEILVEAGENVVSGQKIATVGSTGRSTGNHLCFKVEIGGEYVDPSLVIKPELIAVD